MNNQPKATGMNPTTTGPSPSPICYREYDKPCECEKCQEWTESRIEQLKEVDNGNGK